MMIPFVIYILKASFCLSLITLAYKLMLSKETFFAFNRFILLASIVLSLLIPFIQIDLNSNATSRFIGQQAQTISYYLEENSVEQASIIIPAEESNIASADHINYSSQQEVKPPVSLLKVFTYVYLLGVAAFFLLLCLSFVQMIRLIARGEKTKLENYTLVKTNEQIIPFSWGKYIAISKTEEDLETILLHEEAHIKHKHYLDTLLVEFVIMFQWFNPLVWMLKAELRNTHEYQADSQVLLQAATKAKEYQLLILKKAVGSSSYALANSFNHSKIKKRITMMLKEKSKNRNRFKYLFLIPVVVSAGYLFSSTNLASKSEITENLANTEFSEAQLLPDTSTPQTEYGKIHPPIKPQKKESAPGQLFISVAENKKNENGTTLIARNGTDIFAISSGVVSSIGTDNNANKFIKINHDNQLQSIYTYAGKCLVKEGQEVKGWETIASVGKNELLHLEVYKNGKEVKWNNLFGAIITTTTIKFAPPPPPIRSTKTLDTSFFPPISDKDLKRIAAGYGKKKDPIYGTIIMHFGVDLVADAGTAIYAARNGEVTEASNHVAYGLIVKINHGNGLETWYAHNSKNKVKNGDKVTAGQVIAQVGSTGKATGPHLHFEIRVNDTPIDFNKAINRIESSNTRRFKPEFINALVEGNIELDNYK